MMTTERSEEVICRIVEDRILELETEGDHIPVYYNCVVAIEDNLLVTDYNEWNLQIYSLHDGKLLSSHTLESIPHGVCLISRTGVAVCLSHSIVILSFKSIDDVKRVKTLDVSTRFKWCRSVAKWNSYKLLVSGVNYDAMLCWGVVSITDGRLHSTNNICKRPGYTHMAIKDNTVYISCDTDEYIISGVYAYDIFNPHTHKFLYRHRELKRPWSIMADRNSVFVCDEDSNRIHQLTDSGQLVAIHRISSRLYGIFYDDQHGVLYTTSINSNVITLYKMEYLHQPGVPVEILKMDHRSIQLFEDALKDGKETVHSIRIMVVGHMGVGKTTLVKRLLGEEVISREEVEKINKDGIVQIESSEELDLYLRFLHETGTIIYFSIEVLRENILLDPTWLIDALKSLINAHPDLLETSVDSDTQSSIPTDSVVTQKWSDFKGKGILSSELVDAVWTKEKYPGLHAHKDHMLIIMEQLNIIAKPRAFSEIGEKVENYFLTPCMLRQESPRDIISAAKDSQTESTPVLCFVFRGKFLPPPIFHRLLAACVARWPVAKKKDTSEYLIFCGCCSFDLDLFHRLTLHYKNHIVSARITRMVIDEVNTLDTKLCTRVRKFINLNLSKITSYLGQNLQYDLHAQYPICQGASEDGMVCLSAFQMWFADEGQDSDSSITQEHMNYARLCIALVTVCGNAMRDILLTNVANKYRNIYEAILDNEPDLMSRRRGRPSLNQEQINVVFPDPLYRYVGTVDQFDISLLYFLIRSVSTVPAPSSGWGIDPVAQPNDRSLGASVERIRSYRNLISGHSKDGKINQQDFEDYWNKIRAVLHDIEAVLSRQEYSLELDKQRRRVISIYEAC